MITTPDIEELAGAEAKRALVGERRRRQLQMLQADIGVLQKKYPDLSAVIVGIVSGLQRQTERTRKGDREAVFLMLDRWDATGVTVAELAEELGLAELAVRDVLAELQATAPPLVTYSERPTGGRPLRIYRLTHELP
jgi:hypothetical protein